MRHLTALLGLGAAVSLAAACAEPSKPAFGPENNLQIVNAQDTFALGIDDLKNVYSELSYTWPNSEPRARIFHCSFLPHGDSRLVLTDAVGDTVYDRHLLYRLEGITAVDGAPGDWTVFVGFYGSVGDWADFTMDATADTATAGADLLAICEGRGR